MGRPKNYEQPLQTILRRYRTRGVDWAVLECGHEEPVTGLTLATAVRCQQCNPVWKRIEPSVKLGTV